MTRTGRVAVAVCSGAGRRHAAIATRAQSIAPRQTVNACCPDRLRYGGANSASPLPDKVRACRTRTTPAGSRRLMSAIV